ncbi:DUF4856 domain-containing protein [Croceitalea rosinachiae]|uniref:DUF4856 domain-containing protein n=1 Tax=Croceitalea rosinachiae TaxID=3075596 RepID=A0ABU3AE18_9FLAO|nr:DUF4856 domain-containing protein [Croceitalea sp. F388]MDT0608234.1 DUF4856 domain-containing protein [Croceitalea sp. F388]
MKKFAFALMALTSMVFIACDSDDDDMPEVVATCSDNIQNGDETGVDCGGSSCTPCETAAEIPANYVFARDGESTVSFSGQTTRLFMANEILGKFKDPSSTVGEIQAMFAHAEGADDFADSDLNTSDKNVKSKTAGSFDYFSNDPVTQASVRADFDAYITEQVNDVFPNWNEVATEGSAGQLPDGSSTRYVNANGLELDQAFNKGLIGAFVGDQILNNYTSPAQLSRFEDDNDNDVIVDGKTYTDMEHDWDEAYGYAFGVVSDTENPIANIDDLDATDKFLAKYIKRAENDPTFTGIAQDIFDAYKVGRTAIINKDYDERNRQTDILREAIAKVIAIRSVFYLQAGKTKIEASGEPGDIFHDLSEGFGFIYSLQFTRRPGAEDAYFTRTETLDFLNQIYANNTNGFWNVTPETLDEVSEAIAVRFDFTVADAADSNN